MGRRRRRRRAKAKMTGMNYYYACWCSHISTDAAAPQN